MEHIGQEQIEDTPFTRVWSVQEFCKRHRLDAKEQNRLIQMFGNFATGSELLNNAKREPRFR